MIGEYLKIGHGQFRILSNSSFRVFLPLNAVYPM